MRGDDKQCRGAEGRRIGAVKEQVGEGDEEQREAED
jgi:hypothetical protein